MHILAVGVGSDINTRELRAIAMNDSKSVFNVSEYLDLVKILKDVLVESCKKGMFALMFYLTIFIISARWIWQKTGDFKKIIHVEFR